jgi:hypothetical protein
MIRDGRLNGVRDGDKQQSRWLVDVQSLERLRESA